MARWSLGLAAVALVAALIWFVAAGANSTLLGVLLASAILALTAWAMVVQPGGARPGDGSAREVAVWHRPTA